ncbi:MAG: NAD(P)H-dependent oxidoreductase subunit E [Chromatiales bacterium]|nr:NAD(P)H-dependent oxidoreductase subunit E [Chromatiales bacterium]
MLADVGRGDRHRRTSCSGRSTGERSGSRRRSAAAVASTSRDEIDHWVGEVPAGPQALGGDRGAARRAARAAATSRRSRWTRVAGYLGLPPIQVYEVATLLLDVRDLKPVGRHHISVCTNISCMLCGGETIAGARREAPRHQGRREHAGRRGSSSRRKRSASRACSGAPMMMVDHDVLREPDARRRSTRSCDEHEAKGATVSRLDTIA